MTILPLTYLGSTDYFSLLAAGDCVVDVGENWVKQTARNRAEILTANGVAALTVPVHGGSVYGCGGKIATKDVRIDNSLRWQHRHWISMVSAYKNSPFFDHYEDRFAPFFTVRKWDFLQDLNLELLELLTSILGISMPPISENYVVASPEDLDFRGKKVLAKAGYSGDSSSAFYASLGMTSPYQSPYIQVFSDRFPFAPNLSVIDLLFCEGVRF